MSPYGTETEMRPTRTDDCGCGCGGGKSADCGCESRCCDLDCLVRPRFFCGQTLTDTDLSAAIEWARSRFALSRYRDGWGVVCGLNLMCHDPGNSRSCCGDATKGPTVYVTPGYAIDCCGNDLVLCEPLAVSLAQICRPADDPCLPTWRPTVPAPDPPQPPVRGTSVVDDCMEKLTQNLFAVEVRLKYHEKLTQAQRAMFRSGCADTSGCEYTRVREQPCASVEVVPLTEPPDEGEAWALELRNKMRIVVREITAATTVDLRTALQYVRTHPPHTLCFIEDLLCCLRTSEPAGADAAKTFTEEWGEMVRMYLFLDWYLHQLECGCYSCKPDHGVPIARVLLARFKTADGDRCRVIAIDSKEPYRRPLRVDSCRPAIRGKIDLGQHLWQPLESVQAHMQASGVVLETEPVGVAKGAFNKVVDSALRMPEEGRPLRAFTILDPFKRERVIAFS